VLGGKARSASKSCFRRSTDGGDGLAAPPGPTAAFGGGARRSGALRSAARFWPGSEHEIPPGNGLRYSITFRAVRSRSRPAPRGL